LEQAGSGRGVPGGRGRLSTATEKEEERLEYAERFPPKYAGATKKVSIRTEPSLQFLMK
jgi:hypothetical protein